MCCLYSSYPVFVLWGLVWDRSPSRVPACASVRGGARASSGHRRQARRHRGRGGVRQRASPHPGTRAGSRRGRGPAAGCLCRSGGCARVGDAAGGLARVPPRVSVVGSLLLQGARSLSSRWTASDPVACIVDVTEILYRAFCLGGLTSRSVSCLVRVFFPLSGGHVHVPGGVDRGADGTLRCQGFPVTSLP